MAKKNLLVKSEEKMSRANAAAFLRQLADKLEGGTVTLIQGTQEVVLEVPQQVELEVQVDDKPKRRGTKRSLEIEIEWMVGVDGQLDTGILLGE